MTIKLGSHGSQVAAWQRFLGLHDDGIFGPGTLRATIAWQKAHHLFADGIVGPDTLHAADLGAESATVQARPASPADLNAKIVADRAGSALGLNEAEKQYVLTVARGEGFYGLGWKVPGQGLGSHNWGAVQGIGPAGAFQHLDHHADGTPYTTNFKAYNNDDEGFSDMAKILLKDNVKSALSKKSLREAVFAQHSNRYFELDPEKYLSAVLRNYDALTSSDVIEKILSEKGVSIVGAIVGFLLLIGSSVAGYRYFKS